MRGSTRRALGVSRRGWMPWWAANFLASRARRSRAHWRWRPRASTERACGAAGGRSMAGIDEKRRFIAVSIAVLTVSDTRTLADDTSGDALAERIGKAGHRVAARAIEKDDAGLIERHLRGWIADPEIDVVITTG